MRPKRASPDQLVAEIADRQHGVITVGQLLWAGLTRSAIKRRVQSARLHPVHRGVYAVGRRTLTVEGHWMAAVLALGEMAVLGFESAGALWGMISRPRTPFPVHVVLPSYSGRRRRKGITVHRSATLSRRDTTRRKNIPVTTPARTRRDLGFESEKTRSHLERAFLLLVRAAGLPRPEVNVRVGRYEVDFLWRDVRVIVEVDGWSHHSNRSSFEADRRRDRDLRLRGYTVLRFTYREVTEDPRAVVASLSAHLRGIQST